MLWAIVITGYYAAIAPPLTHMLRVTVNIMY